MQTVLEPRRPFPPPPNGSAAAVGVFDGVHLGHQAVLRETVERARSRGAAAAVLTFRRHPRRLLTGKAPPAITSLEHRLVLLERAGVDLVLVADFDEALRDTSAEDFVRHWLVGRLGSRAVVLGPDAKVGKNREGTPSRLAEMGTFLGFEVVVVPPVLVGGRPARSSAIREAIASGDLAAAAAFLGRRVSVRGTVVHGDGRGRSIGLPTANLNLHHELRPPRGVYAVDAAFDGERRRGVANLGVRPTFGGTETEVVEVHLPGFAGELYGKTIEVEFLAKLREERRFAGVEELRAAIRADVAAAIAFR
ncbi:MAG TPA: riboflavin biosynthesis protein RibF [Planctomycetota bacterium]|jgi:riboflavin kinase/FMN adenylyltransferase|nr:riboflavin biosynthesis protein RibF [Planctomycetota bacterium]